MRLGIHHFPAVRVLFQSRIGNPELTEKKSCLVTRTGRWFVPTETSRDHLRPLSMLSEKLIRFQNVGYLRCCSQNQASFSVVLRITLRNTRIAKPDQTPRALKPHTYSLRGDWVHSTFVSIYWSDMSCTNVLYRPPSIHNFEQSAGDKWCSSAIYRNLADKPRVIDVYLALNMKFLKKLTWRKETYAESQILTLRKFSKSNVSTYVARWQSQNTGLNELRSSRQFVFLVLKK